MWCRCEHREESETVPLYWKDIGRGHPMFDLQSKRTNSDRNLKPSRARLMLSIDTTDTLVMHISKGERSHTFAVSMSNA